MSKIVKVRRLVKGGEVNSNGYLFEEETLNKALELYIEKQGLVKLDNLTLEETNEYLRQNAKPEEWDKSLVSIGKIVDFDKETITVQLFTDKDGEDINDMTANIHVTSTDIDASNPECKIAKIDHVEQILIRDYE